MDPRHYRVYAQLSRGENKQPIWVCVGFGQDRTPAGDILVTLAALPFDGKLQIVPRYLEANS